MRWRTLPLTLVATTAAAQPPAPGRAGRLAPPPGTVAVLADTATVRRICAQPDSVIAGRRACVLRDQRAIVKVF